MVRDEIPRGHKDAQLEGEAAIVTGAGRNIGEEIARLFAAEGAKVAIVDLDRPRGEAVAAAIKADGGEAEMFVADVAKGSDVAALVHAVVGRFGGVDILVNNVAISDKLAPHNIRVNAIVPNKIGSPVGKDEFDPSRPVPNMPKRPGQPAEAAKAVLFLVGEDLRRSSMAPTCSSTAASPRWICRCAGRSGDVAPPNC